MKHSDVFDNSSFCLILSSPRFYLHRNLKTCFYLHVLIDKNTKQCPLFDDCQNI